MPVFAHVETTIHHVNSQWRSTRHNHGLWNMCNKTCFARMSLCSLDWPLGRSARKHSTRLEGSVEGTEMSALFVAIVLPLAIEASDLSNRRDWVLSNNGLWNLCDKKLVVPLNLHLPVQPLDKSVQKCPPRLNGGVERTRWRGFFVTRVANVAASASLVDIQ
jgi:hypothetical protein